MLFKKSPEPTKEVRIVPNPTVEDIHREFDDASDCLLQKVKKILEEEWIADTETLTKLSELGFTSMREVKEYQAIYSTRKEAIKIAEQIKYFKEKYPFNKYIHDNDVKNICEKHGLYLGGPSSYIGNIPAKNKKEIINFKIKNEDITYSVVSRWSARMVVNHADAELYKGNISYNVSERTMAIVASPDMFNLIDKKIVSGYKIEDIPKDPIVLYPVMDGYLIISKWGNEENIEELE